MSSIVKCDFHSRVGSGAAMPGSTNFQGQEVVMECLLLLILFIILEAIK